MHELCGIILAAGESRRMKVQKLLLPFQGKTIIEKVIENLNGTGINRIVVVTGAGKDGIIRLTAHLPVEYCYNDNYKQGMLSSVKCGFRALAISCEAALIFLGDQPMISARVINTVIKAYQNSGRGIVIPVYNKKRGHPLLIDSKYRDEIENLDDSSGLRSLAYRFQTDVLEVKVNDPGILRDIDTKEEYLNELNKTK